MFCAAIVGASLGFLWFNCYPATVFMGDVGSLALGGSLGMIAVLIKKELWLMVLGGVFVIEAGSVILQVFSFKLTGKRIFKMSPFHHHLQLSGWNENKIIVRFWIVAIILAMLTITTLKFGKQMSFDLKNKKVTIIGAARSGIAVADAVLRLGGIAKISENKPLDEFSPQLKELSDPARVTIEAGGHTKAFIQDSDYVVVKPGRSFGCFTGEWARERGIEVMGEVEFAFRLCPCPMVAVTGSNGKTTTSTVIAEILKNAGRTVCLCGNIGSPFSKHVLDLKPTDTVVLEISSFQLESTIHFKPHVAVWTNFSQNHLDRHKDLEEYFQAKCKIFANQDSAGFCCA